MENKISNHNVIMWTEIGNYLITLIEYKKPEIDKRLFIFKDIRIGQLQISDNIPKGFFDNHDIQPTAMFIPDKNGWDTAMDFCRAMQNK